MQPVSQPQAHYHRTCFNHLRPWYRADIQPSVSGEISSCSSTINNYDGGQWLRACLLKLRDLRASLRGPLVKYYISVFTSNINPLPTVMSSEFSFCVLAIILPLCFSLAVPHRNRPLTPGYCNNGFVGGSPCWRSCYIIRTAVSSGGQCFYFHFPNGAESLSIPEIKIKAR